MKKIKSLSDKRLIIKVTFNGIGCNLLCDSGASVGLLDSSAVKKMRLPLGSRYSGTIVGAGGEVSTPYIVKTIADFEGVKVGQFLSTNIHSICDSIKKETGLTIVGILSLPQAKMMNLQYDFNDMEIIIE